MSFAEPMAPSSQDQHAPGPSPTVTAPSAVAGTSSHRRTTLVAPLGVRPGEGKATGARWFSHDLGSFPEPTQGTPYYILLARRHAEFVEAPIPKQEPQYEVGALYRLEKELATRRAAKFRKAADAAKFVAKLGTRRKTRRKNEQQQGSEAVGSAVAIVPATVEDDVVDQPRPGASSSITIDAPLLVSSDDDEGSDTETPLADGEGSSPDEPDGTTSLVEESELVLWLWVEVSRHRSKKEEAITSTLAQSSSTNKNDTALTPLGAALNAERPTMLGSLLQIHWERSCWDRKVAQYLITRGRRASLPSSTITPVAGAASSAQEAPKSTTDPPPGFLLFQDAAQISNTLLAFSKENLAEWTRVLDQYFAAGGSRCASVGSYVQVLPGAFVSFAAGCMLYVWRNARKGRQFFFNQRHLFEAGMKYNSAKLPGEPRPAHAFKLSYRGRLVCVLPLLSIPSGSFGEAHSVRSPTYWPTGDASLVLGLNSIQLSRCDYPPPLTLGGSQQQSVGQGEGTSWTAEEILAASGMRTVVGFDGKLYTICANLGPRNFQLYCHKTMSPECWPSRYTNFKARPPIKEVSLNFRTDFWRRFLLKAFLEDAEAGNLVAPAHFSSPPSKRQSAVVKRPPALTTASVDQGHSSTATPGPNRRVTIVAPNASAPVVPTTTNLDGTRKIPLAVVEPSNQTREQYCLLVLEGLQNVASELMEATLLMLVELRETSGAGGGVGPSRATPASAADYRRFAKATREVSEEAATDGAEDIYLFRRKKQSQEELFCTLLSCSRRLVPLAMHRHCVPLRYLYLLLATIMDEFAQEEKTSKDELILRDVIQAAVIVEMIARTSKKVFRAEVCHLGRTSTKLECDLLNRWFYTNILRGYGTWREQTVPLLLELFIDPLPEELLSPFTIPNAQDMAETVAKPQSGNPAKGQVRASSGSKGMQLKRSKSTLKLKIAAAAASANSSSESLQLQHKEAFLRLLPQVAMPVSLALPAATVLESLLFVEFDAQFLKFTRTLHEGGLITAMVHSTADRILDSVLAASMAPTQVLASSKGNLPSQLNSWSTGRPAPDWDYIQSDATKRLELVPEETPSGGAREDPQKRWWDAANSKSVAIAQQLSVYSVLQPSKRSVGRRKSSDLDENVCEVVLGTEKWTQWRRILPLLGALRHWFGMDLTLTPTSADDSSPPRADDFTVVESASASAFRGIIEREIIPLFSSMKKSPADSWLLQTHLLYEYFRAVPSLPMFLQKQSQFTKKLVSAWIEGGGQNRSGPLVGKSTSPTENVLDSILRAAVSESPTQQAWASSLLRLLPEGESVVVRWACNPAGPLIRLSASDPTYNDKVLTPQLGPLVFFYQLCFGFPSLSASSTLNILPWKVALTQAELARLLFYTPCCLEVWAPFGSAQRVVQSGLDYWTPIAKSLFSVWNRNTRALLAEVANKGEGGEVFPLLLAMRKVTAQCVRAVEHCTSKMPETEALPHPTSEGGRKATRTRGSDRSSQKEFDAVVEWCRFLRPFAQGLVELFQRAFGASNEQTAVVMSHYVVILMMCGETDEPHPDENSDKSEGAETDNNAVAEATEVAGNGTEGTESQPDNRAEVTVEDEAERQNANEPISKPQQKENKRLDHLAGKSHGGHNETREESANIEIPADGLWDDGNNSSAATEWRPPTVIPIEGLDEEFSYQPAEVDGLKMDGQGELTSLQSKGEGANAALALQRKKEKERHRRECLRAFAKQTAILNQQSVTEFRQQLQSEHFRHSLDEVAFTMQNDDAWKNSAVVLQFAEAIAAATSNKSEDSVTAGTGNGNEDGQGESLKAKQQAIVGAWKANAQRTEAAQHVHRLAYILSGQYRREPSRVSRNWLQQHTWFTAGVYVLEWTWRFPLLFLELQRREDILRRELELAAFETLNGFPGSIEILLREDLQRQLRRRYLKLREMEEKLDDIDQQMKATFPQERDRRREIVRSEKDARKLLERASVQSRVHARNQSIEREYEEAQQRARAIQQPSKRPATLPGRPTVYRKNSPNRPFSNDGANDESTPVFDGNMRRDAQERIRKAVMESIARKQKLSDIIREARGVVEKEEEQATSSTTVGGGSRYLALQEAKARRAERLQQLKDEKLRAIRSRKPRYVDYSSGYSDSDGEEQLLVDSDLVEKQLRVRQQREKSQLSRRVFEAKLEGQRLEKEREALRLRLETAASLARVMHEGQTPPERKPQKEDQLGEEQQGEHVESGRTKDDARPRGQSLPFLDDVQTDIVNAHSSEEFVNRGSPGDPKAQRKSGKGSKKSTTLLEQQKFDLERDLVRMAKEKRRLLERLRNAQP